MIAGGEIYGYSLEAVYSDGRRASSPHRLFGVDRTEILSLQLTGEAFETGSDVLSPKAREVLSEAAAILQRYPEEVVVIDGHTDSVGSKKYNLELSRRRAAAAASYLAETLGRSPDDFVIRYFGEDRPIAPNSLEDGRALNRRVELHGEIEDTEYVTIKDAFRTERAVSINGTAAEIGAAGQFFHRFTDPSVDRLSIEANDSQGRSARATVQMPRVEVATPSGEFLLSDGGWARGCQSTRVSGEDTATESSRVVCRLAGRTNPGSTLHVRGVPVPVDERGEFGIDIQPQLGRNSYDLLIRNAEGFNRITNLQVSMTDRDADGHYIVVREGIPNLSVDLPPDGTKLNESKLHVSGATDPGNTIRVNDQPVETRSDGSFAVEAELPVGRSRLVIEVRDPDGATGAIEREFEVARHNLFLLAFADGKIGALSAEGLVEGAGLDDDSDFYAEGRLAFYLKGRIAGKYIITSAFDSGKDEVEYLFQNIDAEETETLLRNIDPDKFYPVYGDASTVVYDAESEGKFYLALDSDEIHAVVGNYPLNLNDTELAAYRRTLYGGRFAYESTSRTPYGDPDTRVVLFGAEIKQAHIRDELRATGGSLYYLSHQDVIEGSEQVILVVRDKNTGLTLSQDVQRQNLDYTIKYQEGRIMFHRPISSVIAGGSLVDQEILSGHPVFIEVDYETELRSFEKTGYGARVRRQIGDHVAVGGTFLHDELQAGEYELTGVDAEFKLGKNNRITIERAESTGNDALAYISDDGGVSYTEVPVGGVQEGGAWKVAADLDIGEWFSVPERYHMRAYFKELEPEFFSNGNRGEQGSRKMGVSASARMTEKQSLRVRVDRNELVEEGAPGTLDRTDISSVQWERKGQRWGVAAELLERDPQDAAGNSLGATSFAAARYWSKPIDKLSTRVDHQQTIDGEENDQTTVAVQYDVLSSLSFEVQGTDGSIGRSTQAGAILKLQEGTIELARRMSEDGSGRRDTTVLGAKAPLGKSSKVYTEYQWEQAESGDQVISLLGLQKQWDIAPGFRFTLSGETSDTDSGPTERERSAFTTSLSYAKPERITALSRSTLRFDEGTSRQVQLSSLTHVDYRLNDDLTLLGKYRYSKTRDRDTDVTEARLEERSVGLAYRPVRHDRFNSLFRYSRLLDQQPIGAGLAERPDRTLEVVSAETAYQVVPRLEWLSKGALRWHEEALPGSPTVSTRTQLAIQRLNIGIRGPFEVGAEYRMLRESETESRRQGWLTEFGWRVQKHFRLGLGYNFTDFSDNELSQNDYSVHGWFLRVQGMY